MKKNAYGFTIVELLIVIVVIGILATVSIVSYSGIQARARDTRRAQDIANIKHALITYDTMHQGVESTGTTKYTGSNLYSGWDASQSPTWLAFLRTEHGMMPVDPKNTTVTSGAANPPLSGNRVYYYYCYKAGTGLNPAMTSDYVRLGYHKDNDTSVYEDIPVTACL